MFLVVSGQFKVASTETGHNQTYTDNNDNNEKKENKQIKDSRLSAMESFGRLVLLSCGISTYTPAAYQRSHLLRP